MTEQTEKQQSVVPVPITGLLMIITFLIGGYFGDWNIYK